MAISGIISAHLGDHEIVRPLLTGLTSYPGTRFTLRFMRIGEVAAKAGVNRQTLRYYEREGLLPNPTRRDNGYREYPDTAVALVRFIKRAQDLGFSLEEAKGLSKLRRTAGPNRPRVRALAEAKLLDVQLRIRDLRAIEGVLRRLLTDCCGSDAPGCVILDALNDPPCPSSEPRETDQ